MYNSNESKNQRLYRSRWLIGLVMLLGLFVSCNKEDKLGEDKSVAPMNLRYPELTGAFEGMEFTSARPVVVSSTDPTFEIVGGTSDIEGAYNENIFQIDATNGVVSLLADNELIASVYSLDIKVINSYGETVFPKAFNVQILPSVARDLVYTPALQTIVKGNMESKTTAPAYKGTSGGTYSLVDEERFVIDENTGEISLSPESNIEAGIYSLTIAVTNEAGIEEFEDVVNIQIESMPYGLSYDPATVGEVQVTQGKLSTQPTVEGTGPFTFALDAAPDGFTIDAETGVITLVDGHTLAVGVYPLSVNVTNVHGVQRFENVISYEIVPKQLVVASELSYSPSEYTIKTAKWFQSVQPTLSGSSPYTFQLVGASDEIMIDETTGVISLNDGHGLAEGTYNLTVKVLNEAGEVDFNNSVVLNIVAPSEEVIFEDGWDGLSYPDLQNVEIGNFTSSSLSGDPVLLKTKWKNVWTLGGVGDDAGTMGPGMLILPNKEENEDWLVTNRVDLTGASNARLEFSAYSRYAQPDRFVFELYVSTDYSGNVETANWVKVEINDIANSGTDHVASNQMIDLSRFDGQEIYIGFKSHVFALPSDPADYTVKGATYLHNVEVIGVR